MNHPIRVAERAAALDIISDGRLEFGTARSSTWTELGGFKVDPDDTKKTWDEFVRVLPRMWADEPFEYEGGCFSMPERNVLPKPVQKPHPPMWVTVTSPGTELDAAERGLGCLGVAAASYAEQERRTSEYHRRIQSVRSGGRGRQRPGHHAELPLLPRGPWPRPRRPGMRMVQLFGLANSHLLWTREAYPTRAYQSLGNLAPRRRDRPLGGPGDARRASRKASASAIPTTSCRVIKRWESIGVTGINFLLNALETVPQEEVLGEHAAVRRRGDAEVSRRGIPRRSMLSGAADLDALAARAPMMQALDVPPLRLEEVEVLQATFELPYASREPLLPPGLHPTTPPLLVVLAWSVGGSPWGPFSMAQTRISCRSGVRPAGSSPAASSIPPAPPPASPPAGGCRPGPEPSSWTAGTTGSSSPPGSTAPPRSMWWASIPMPLDPGDVQFTITTTLARTPAG